MKQCTAYDFMELTSRKITPEGFLEAPATLARTGIQLYRAREFGLDSAMGMDGDKIIKLFRPSEEVFNNEAMMSFDGKPVIMEPHQTVTADNWKELAVGDVHGIRCHGSLLAADRMVIRDKDAIDAIQNGKKFLSNGYTFDLDMTPGVTAEGEAYDGMQRNIRGNHVAIVSSPRGGSACRIADSATVAQGERKMKKITVNGIPVEVGDNEAGIIEKLTADLDAARTVQPSIVVKVGDASVTITGTDNILKEITARDAKIVELEAKVLSPEQVDALVESRLKTIGDAGHLVKDFDAKGKSNSVIHREVIATVCGKDSTAKAVVDVILAGKEAKDASDDIVAMAFAAIVATGVKAEAAAASTTAGDAEVAAALTATGKKEGKDADHKPSGRDAFIARQNQAWQKR